MNLLQNAITTGISTKADKEPIDVLEDTHLKLKFSRNNLIQVGYHLNKHVQLFQLKL